MSFTEMFEEKSFLYSPNCHKINNYKFSSSFGHFWQEMWVIFNYYDIPCSCRHIVGRKSIVAARDWEQAHYHRVKTADQLYCGPQRCWQKMSSSSVVPVVLWGSTPPSHCISCVITTYDQKTVVTGSTDGQLGIWDLRFADDGEIKVSLRGRGVYIGGDLGASFFPKKCQVVTFLT